MKYIRLFEEITWDIAIDQVRNMITPFMDNLVGEYTTWSVGPYEPDNDDGWFSSIDDEEEADDVEYVFSLVIKHPDAVKRLTKSGIFYSEINIDGDILDDNIGEIKRILKDGDMFSDISYERFYGNDIDDKDVAYTVYIKLGKAFNRGVRTGLWDMKGGKK